MECNWLEFIQLCTKLKVEILECMEKEHGMPKEAIEWINQVKKHGYYKLSFHQV
jgi:hypothetical protein